VALLYFPLLLGNDTFKHFVLPEKSTQPVQTMQFTMPPVAALVIGGIVTVLVMALTVYILLKVPAAVAQKGQKLTQTPANALVPIVTHHKKISAKKRLQISARLVVMAKLLLIATPLLLSLGAYGVPTPITPEVMVVIAGFFAGGSLLWFIAQYAFSVWLKITPNQLV
jgi:hypothetical protein